MESRGLSKMLAPDGESRSTEALIHRSMVMHSRNAIREMRPSTLSISLSFSRRGVQFLLPARDDQSPNHSSNSSFMYCSCNALRLVPSGPFSDDCLRLISDSLTWSIVLSQNRDGSSSRARAREREREREVKGVIALEEKNYLRSDRSVHSRSLVRRDDAGRTSRVW